MGSASPMQGRCGARNRGERKGTYCTRFPLAGSTRCRKHGSAQPSGPAAHAWKHGRYSKLASWYGTIGKDVAEAADDADLLDVRRTIALLEVALRKATERMDAARSERDQDAALSTVLDRAERLHRAITSALDTMTRSANVLTREHAQVIIRALFGIVKEETAPEAFARIASRFDAEVMQGRLAKRGVLVRAVEVEEAKP